MNIWDGLWRTRINYTPEDQANKITTWGTPTDVQYPSAKLTKDSLDLKIPFTVAEDTNMVTGFLNRTESILSFVAGTRTFSVSPVAAQFTIYSEARTTVFTTSQSIQIPNTVGIHYIYFASGVISTSMTAWDIAGAGVLIAIIFWNGSTGRIWDERHGANRNSAWHKYQHQTVGMAYESGLQGTFADATFSIALGEVHDEDIEHILSAQTTALIVYRTAGGVNMTFDDSPVTTSYRQAAGVLQYDDGDGTPANVQNNRYGVSWIYATNDQTTPVYCVMGQGEYTTLANARNSAYPSIPISTAEWKLLYKVIYRNVGGAATFIEALDYRIVTSGPPVVAPPATTIIGANVNLDTTDFDKILSPTENTAQLAFEKIDEALFDLTGGIIVYHKNCTASYYKPSADTDIARGTALYTAWGTAVQGDVIQLGAGVYHIGANEIDLQAVTNVTIKGRGRYSTTIKGSEDYVIKPGTNCEISDLTIRWGTIETGNVPLGTDDTAFTKMVCRNLFIYGTSQGVGLNPTGTSTISFYDCEITSGYDAVYIEDSSLVATFYNCKIYSSYYAAIDPSLCCGVNIYNATGIFHNCDISASGHPTYNYGIVLSGTAIAEINGGKINQTGTNDFAIYSTSTSISVKLAPDVQFDYDKVYYQAKPYVTVMQEIALSKITPLGDEVMVNTDNTDLGDYSRRIRYFKIQPPNTSGTYNWTIELPEAGKNIIENRNREICIINSSVANGYAQVNLTVIKNNDEPGGRILMSNQASLISQFSMGPHTCTYLYSTLLYRGGNYKWVWAVTLPGEVPPPT